MDAIIQRIAQELNQKAEYVENVVRLLDAVSYTHLSRQVRSTIFSLTWSPSVTF